MTMIFTVAVLGIILIYDGYIMIKGGTEASISYLIITASYSYPLIPFFGGMIVGHFWWRMRDDEKTRKISENTRK
jgi:uncharacterized oligopeptide transporter (OPT) family protein